MPDPALVGQPCGRDDGVCGADGTCACPPERPTTCRRGCVDTASDPDNCGACDNRCPRTGHGTATAPAASAGSPAMPAIPTAATAAAPTIGTAATATVADRTSAAPPTGAYACRCVIGIDSFDAGEINPDNACQFCDPTRNRHDWTTSDRWRLLRRRADLLQRRVLLADRVLRRRPVHRRQLPGPVRNPGPTGRSRTSAIRPTTARSASRRATASIGPSSTTRPPAAVCPGGSAATAECCSPTECCGETSCEECGPHCRIGDADIPADTVNPDRSVRALQARRQLHRLDDRGRRYRVRHGAGLLCRRVLPARSVLQRRRVRRMRL